LAGWEKRTRRGETSDHRGKGVSRLSLFSIPYKSKIAEPGKLG